MDTNGDQGTAAGFYGPRQALVVLQYKDRLVPILVEAPDVVRGCPSEFGDQVLYATTDCKGQAYVSASAEALLLPRTTVGGSRRSLFGERVGAQVENVNVESFKNADDDTCFSHEPALFEVVAVEPLGDFGKFFKPPFAIRTGKCDKAVTVLNGQDIDLP